MVDVLPGHSPEEIALTVAEHWEFHAGYLPLPKFELHCPQCAGTDIQLSTVVFGKRAGSGSPYRADVAFKCCQCSMYWIHNVPVPADVYARAGGNVKLRWRQVKKIIEGDNHA